MGVAHVLDDAFHKSRPYALNEAMLLKRSVGVDAMAQQVKTAVEEWRAPPAPDS